MRQLLRGALYIVLIAGLTGFGAYVVAMVVSLILRLFHC